MRQNEERRNGQVMGTTEVLSVLRPVIILEILT